MKGALSGVKVVELGDNVSAPYCSKLLADLGAEVIKVEKPVTGDDARKNGPFPNDEEHIEKSGLFLYLNANKLGVTLDPSNSTGKGILDRLLGSCDVMIENLSVNKKEDIGITYSKLKEKHPRLIVTSISPFGQTGPYRKYKGYSINSAAAGGMNITMGDPAREPLTPPSSLGQFQSGSMAAVATLGAIIARTSTNVGQEIDISESEVWATHHTGYAVNSYVFHNVKKRRSGHRIEALYPNGIFPCKDGYVSLTTIKGAQWKKFIEMVGGGSAPDWYVGDPRFENWKEITHKYGKEIESLLAPFMMNHTKAELFALGREGDIPIAPVRTIEEVVDCSFLKEREYFVDIDHAVSGKMSYPGAPYRLSESPFKIRRPAPTLGEHNKEIYCGRLGIAEEELRELEKTGTI